MNQITFSQWTHDIRNALGTIALYVDTLDCPANPQSSQTVASTQALLARIAAMCSSAAKLTEAGPRATRASFDVARTIVQVRELIASSLPKGVSLQIEVPEPTPVVADAQDAFRILFNLLHNAATVARRTGELHTMRVTLRRSDGMASITVADDGPGVPAAIRRRLFLGGRSTTGGSGQGLAIARELAERNGGTLKLVDETQGATFVLELPLDASAVDRVTTLSDERARRAKAGRAVA